jgi:hypothetical protein
MSFASKCFDFASTQVEKPYIRGKTIYYNACCPENLPSNEEREAYFTLHFAFRVFLRIHNYPFNVEDAFNDVMNMPQVKDQEPHITCYVYYNLLRLIRDFLKCETDAWYYAQNIFKEYEAAHGACHPFFEGYNNH